MPHAAMSGDRFGLIKERVPLTSSEARVFLNILQCTGQPSQQKWSKTSVVLKLRILGL